MKKHWIGNTLDHNLVNPKQLSNYGIPVQDSLMSESPLAITTKDGEFSMELSMEETIAFSNTHLPSDKQI